MIFQSSHKPFAPGLPLNKMEVAKCLSEWKLKSHYGIVSLPGLGKSAGSPQNPG